MNGAVLSHRICGCLSHCHSSHRKLLPVGGMGRREARWESRFEMMLEPESEESDERTL